MRKIHGMSIKDWKTLGKILNPTTTDCGCRFDTVVAYIENHPECVTNRRVSTKGTEIVEVTYTTGKVKEYPVAQIATTTAFEY